jgi:hypothetical protein
MVSGVRFLVDDTGRRTAVQIDLKCQATVVAQGLQTAKRLGLTIPHSILLRADKVIN